MCVPWITTHWNGPSWCMISRTSTRTPTKVNRKETEATNKRCRGRSGMVERTRKPSRVNCSSTSSVAATRLAKASNKSAPVPGILY